MFNFTSQNNCDDLIILYHKHATEAYNFCLRVHQEIAKNIKRKSLSKEGGKKGIIKYVAHPSATIKYPQKIHVTSLSTFFTVFYNFLRILLRNLE
jgi:hypothetical protein